MVADKAGNRTVDSFIGIATVSQIRCPVLKGRVVFATMAPLNRKAPALLVNFFCKHMSCPGTIITRLAIAPDIYIDKV